MARPDLQAIEKAAKPPVPALCCECGNLRTVSADYHFGINDENRGEGLFMGTRGWIHTGTLKCSHCRARTRHALLNKEGERDYADDYQRYVLGGNWDGQYPPDRERLRERYFAQFPRNPHLHHWYLVDDAQAAWDTGERTVTSLCGEQMTLHRDPKKASSSRGRNSPTEPVEPDEMRDMEYEDPETGLWWVDMDCVNCLRVTNTRRLERKRTALLAQLVEAAGAVKNMAAEDVAALAEHLDRIMANA